ncbi:MAG: PaeR7I family type II restriction endonuclease [Thermomicrobiales bacterium]
MTSSAFPWTDKAIAEKVRAAVQHYWATRTGQASKQLETGVADAGSRGQVTGGQHLNEFVALFCGLITEAGFTDDELRFRTGVELPGFYRPTKKWDVVVIRKGRLCAAIELKSQVGPSFGNNFNNRTEEAVGSSVDLWRAFQEGTLGGHPPWLGYFFFLQEDTRSTTPVRLASSVFAPDKVFLRTSYADRYRILCQRMVLERKYNGATLLLSPRGNDGSYHEASDDLSIASFLKSLYGHLIGCG